MGKIKSSLACITQNTDIYIQQFYKITSTTSLFTGHDLYKSRNIVKIHLQLRDPPVAVTIIKTKREIPYFAARQNYFTNSTKPFVNFVGIRPPI